MNPCFSTNKPPERGLAVLCAECDLAIAALATIPGQLTLRGIFFILLFFLGTHILYLNNKGQALSTLLPVKGVRDEYMVCRINPAISDPAKLRVCICAPDPVSVVG
jgi:hypothetical protein